MAIRPDTASMLMESLPEYLFVAERCVRYQKDASWGPPHQVGGRLGYPAAVMLFCIVDTIGSFHRRDREMEHMTAEERLRYIRGKAAATGLGRMMAEDVRNATP